MSPGDTLGGKYHIERIIGQGCMGVVMAARHIHLDERVAIKFMLPDVLNDSEHVARFLREARAASRIKNEHVARVMDVDVMPGGQPYIVMEYLEGQDLGELLDSSGPLPAMQAVDYVLEACNALQEAHALGIVHRDFKPANVFLARRPDGRTVIKILDFGISKMKAGDMAMTSTVALMGSPAYMSPEQMMSSRDVDPRTDIWAVGVTLYQLLTGSLPFHGTTVPEVCARVLNVEPLPVRVSRPDVSPHLELVVMRCLVKNREQRFQSVSEFVAALAPFGSVVGSNPREFGPTGSHPSAVTVRASFPQSAGGTVPVWEGSVHGKAARGARRWIIVAVTALGLVAAGLATWALRSMPSSTERPSDPSVRVSATPGDSPPPAATEGMEPAPADHARGTGETPSIAKVAPGEPASAETPNPPRPKAKLLEPSSKTPDPKAFEPAGHGSIDLVPPHDRPAAKSPPARPKPPPKKTTLPSGEDLFSEPK